MALALNNLKRVDMPLNKETKPLYIDLIVNEKELRKDYRKQLYNE